MARPAAGGRASGRRRSATAAEKSRRRVSGVRRTTRWRVAHRRRPALGHDLPPAQAVDRHVERRSRVDDGAGPVVAHAADGGAGGLDGGIQTAARDRRNAARGRNGNIHVPVTHIHNLPTSQDEATRRLGDRRRERYRQSNHRTPGEGRIFCPRRRPEARPDGPGESFAADLTTREGNQAAVDAALERFGRLDAIVPNAGFQHVSPVAEFPEDRWDALLSLLLTSPFLLSKYAWPALRRVGDGRIVVIASAHALAASPFKAGYVSAKHGALGLVKTLALEGAPDGILATAVCPGFVRTPLVEAQIADQAKAHGPPGGGGPREGHRRAARGEAPHRARGGRRRGRVPARPGREVVHRRAGDDGHGLDRALSHDEEPGPGPGLSHSAWVSPSLRRRVLLEKLATRRDVDLGQLAGEAGLGVDDGRDPLDVGLLGDLLLVVGDRLQGLLVGVEVGAAGLLAGGEDPLVEVADALGGLVDGVLFSVAVAISGSSSGLFSLAAVSSLADYIG